MDTMVRHTLRNPTLGQIFPSSFSSYTTMPPTDCHGLCRPILDAISFVALFITLDGRMTDCHRHNGPSRVSVPKHLNSWNMGTDYFSELHDKPAGRVVMATTVRHALRNPTLGQNSPSSFTSCTTMPPTDRNEHNELS